jgi:succinate dehydrogenase / fumarate reductase membrane anchor subunit
VARTYGGRRVKPSGGFELAAWFFMRISGLILVFLALGHLTITHILNNVESINYYFVSSRWANPKTGVLWRLWDLTMINLAVIHGFNGLRQILDEYVTKPGRRVIVHTLIWSSAIFLIGIGSYAILMFRQDSQYLQEWIRKRQAEQPVATAPADPAAARTAAR